MQPAILPFMDITNKIVTKIPLECLWTEEEELDFERQKYLNGEEIKEILKAGPVRLIVADVGQKLKWIPLDKCFERYKKEIKEHIIDHLENIDLEKFKYNFAYIASLWTDKANKKVVVLEQVH